MTDKGEVVVPPMAGLWPLFQLNEATIDTVCLLRKPAWIAPASRSRYALQDASQRATFGLGFAKAIGAVLSGHILHYRTNGDGTLGRVLVRSASASKRYTFSWDQERPSAIAFGGFEGEGRPTYHLPLVHLVACSVGTDQTQQEVRERWQALLTSMYQVFPRPASQSAWGLVSEVRPAFHHAQIRPHIEALADALYFSLRYHRFAPREQREIRITTTSVAPGISAGERSGTSSLLLANPISVSLSGKESAVPRTCSYCGYINLERDPFCEECGAALRSRPSGQGQLPQRSYSVAAPLAQSPLLAPYRFVRALGNGGMGMVFQMEDPLLQRFVAVKVPKPSFEHVLRNEAQRLATLRHSGIPVVYGYSETGLPALLLEYIEGETLDAVAQRCGIALDPLNPMGAKRLSARQVVELGIQLCDILTYLHTRTPAIMFRDLKPENVMLRPDRTLALIDFGLAFAYAAGNFPTDRFGTRGYVPPEHYRREGIYWGPQSDLYALGVMLYQWVTGSDPSVAPLTFPPFLTPPLSIPAPQELETLILQLVASSPSQRPASADAVRRTLMRMQMQAGF